MLSLVFVDDDQNIVQGIQRATRSMRHEWEMSFFDTGTEALAFISENPVDVVVSDMRMPIMDGAELLTRVREIKPAAARIILSGYAEEEAVFRSTRVAHQFLSKPCDVEALRDTISRIFSSRALVQPEVIRELIGKIEQLPALGEVYTELMMAIDQDSSSNEALGRIVSKDVALTAHLLRLINSTFFGLSREVTSASHAIGFLGIDVVRAIVAGHSLFDRSTNPVVDVQELGHRCRAVAILARKAVRLDGGTQSAGAEAYLAGMLHEVGALVLGNVTDFDKEQLTAILASNDSTSERLTLEVDRFVVGGYLLGMWGFSADIVSSISALSPQEMPLDAPIADALRRARAVVATDVVVNETTDDQGLEELLRSVEIDESDAAKAA